MPKSYKQDGDSRIHTQAEAIADLDVFVNSEFARLVGEVSFHLVLENDKWKKYPGSQIDRIPVGISIVYTALVNYIS